MNTRSSHSIGRLHRIHPGQHLGTVSLAAWSPRPACQIQAMWSNWIGRIRDFFFFSLFFFLIIVEKEAAPAPSWTFHNLFFLKWHGSPSLPFALICTQIVHQSRVSYHLVVWTPGEIFIAPDARTEQDRVIVQSSSRHRNIWRLHNGGNHLSILQF